MTQNYVFYSDVSKDFLAYNETTKDKIKEITTISNILRVLPKVDVAVKIAAVSGAAVVDAIGVKVFFDDSNVGDIFCMLLNNKGANDTMMPRNTPITMDMMSLVIITCIIFLNSYISMF
ncbi:MAG: hypothetical protein QW128_06440 [Thermoprotei archaeon]